MEIFGKTIDWALIIALWGAILSTILASIKIIEIWNERFKIKIHYVLRGDIEVGHDICIQNLSGKPVLLEYMEIFGKIKQWPVSKNIILWHPEDSLINSKIEPSSSKCFYFNQADYFSFGQKPIYVRLNFAGRKSIIKKIK